MERELALWKKRSTMAIINTGLEAVFLIKLTTSRKY
jgi:hypothetical protein